MFDAPDALERAKAALFRAGLVGEANIRVEAAILEQDLHPPERPKRLWEKLRKWLGPGSDEQADAFAEGVRRGSTLLVATVPEHVAQKVAAVLAENGAVNLRRRVQQWRSTGWTRFDPPAPQFSDAEIRQERERNAQQPAATSESTRALA
jgi:hypothetical protein